MTRKTVSFKSIILLLVFKTWLWGVKADYEGLKSSRRMLQTECQVGYFDAGSGCERWQSSCYTCTNSTECESCSNRFLNSTTKLWELCPDGSFYSDSLSKCLEWDGSCSGKWAYQLSWFDWPTGQKFQIGTIII